MKFIDTIWTLGAAYKYIFQNFGKKKHFLLFYNLSESVEYKLNKYLIQTKQK